MVIRVQSNVKKTIRWLLLILCAVYIVYFFRANRELLGLLTELRLGFVGALFVSSLFYFVLHGYRYLIVLEKCSDRSIAIRAWSRLFIFGQVLNTVAPQLGNVYRSVHLKRDYGVTYTRFVSVLVSIAWMSMCFNLLMAFLVIELVDSGMRVGPIPATYLVLGLAFGLVAGPIGIKIFFHRVTVKARYLSWLLANAAFYFGLGFLAFKLFERVARNRGLLGHY